MLWWVWDIGRSRQENKIRIWCFFLSYEEWDHMKNRNRVLWPQEVLYSLENLTSQIGYKGFPGECPLVPSSFATTLSSRMMVYTISSFADGKPFCPCKEKFSLWKSDKLCILPDEGWKYLLEFCRLNTDNTIIPWMQRWHNSTSLQFSLSLFHFSSFFVFLIFLYFSLFFIFHLIHLVLWQV